jgi:hypothetical protein
MQVIVRHQDRARRVRARSGRAHMTSRQSRRPSSSSLSRTRSRSVTGPASAIGARGGTGGSQGLEPAPRPAHRREPAPRTIRTPRCADRHHPGHVDDYATRARLPRAVKLDPTSTSSRPNIARGRNIRIRPSTRGRRRAGLQGLDSPEGLRQLRRPLGRFRRTRGSGARTSPRARRQ